MQLEQSESDLQLPYPQLSQSTVGTGFYLLLDLLGSNDRDFINVIISSDVICCVDMPPFITIVLVIDKHTRHCRGITSNEHVIISVSSL